MSSNFCFTHLVNVGLHPTLGHYHPSCQLTKLRVVEECHLGTMYCYFTVKLQSNWSGWRNLGQVGIHGLRPKRKVKAQDTKPLKVELNQVISNATTD